MSKYSALTTFLEETGNTEYSLSFDYIETVILGFKLPKSAYIHRPWWANTSSGHSQSQAWQSIGWETSKVDLKEKRVTFSFPQPYTKLVKSENSDAITIEQAKVGLAAQFGVSPQNIEITIRL